MITISLCMIVRDEAATLDRVLSSVAGIADEIVIVDTGSADDTKRIALQYTDCVYDFSWIDDFAAARNYSFDQAHMDYILWLDADDVLLEPDREAFLALKRTLTADVDIVTMKYNTHFDENGLPTFTLRRERLLKRANDYRWHDPVHEYITLHGNIVNSDICVTHRKEKEHSDRNLRIYRQLEQAGREFSPRMQYYYARELKDHAQYEQAAAYFAKFLDGGQGWVEDNIAACVQLGICENALERPGEATRAFLRSFEYDTPRAEACCEMGYTLKRAGDFKRALFWFDLATKLRLPETLGFVRPDYYAYIPYVELCVCYHMLGDNVRASLCNEQAAHVKGETEAVKYNRAFFKSLGM